jgi:hypothetical protein
VELELRRRAERRRRRRGSSGRMSAWSSNFDAVTNVGDDVMEAAAG